MRKLGLIAAMEAEQAIEDAAVDAGVVGGADNLESSMIDSNEAGDIVEGQMDDVDSTLDDADQLAGHAEIMEDSLENGGMSVDAARTAELAIESIYARIGFTRRQAMPTMESFGAKGNRIAATKLALESVTESIKSIFESVKAFIIKMGAYIKDFLVKLFDANTKLGERATKMAKSVADMPVKTTTATELKSSDSIAKALSIGGKLDGTTLTTGLKNIVTTIGLAPGVGKFISDWVEKMTETKPEDYGYLNLTASTATPVGSSEGFEAPSDNLTTYRCAVLPGNMALISRSASNKAIKGNDAMAAISKSYTKVGAFNGNKPAEKCEKVPVLTHDQMVALVAVVSDLQKSIAKSKEVADKLDKARVTVIGRIKILSTSFVEAGPKAVPVANKIVSAINSIAKMSASVVTSMNKYAITTGKASLDYVEKSAKEYKAGAAETKAE